MAATSRLCEQDLFCPQCSGIYNLPVLLKCGHNICRVCLQKFWELKACRECPVCGTVSVRGRPPINLALKLAAEDYQVRLTTKNKDVCLLHNEKLSIFCHNDEEPICLVCQTSKHHKVHECCPVEEAARQKKGEMSSKLEPLKKKLRGLNKTKKEWEQTKTYIQVQANQDEKVIKDEFDKLREFLQEEEIRRLNLLKQEKETKTRVMCEKLKHIEDQIDKLSSIIADIEKRLGEEDMTFLHDYKQTKKRIKCNIQEPECIRDILIHSPMHVGSLKFGVWKNMVQVLHCAPITFDPNTAHSNLQLSEELTRVQYSSRRLLPDNPERCTNRVCVLGATGFSSGKHRWTVEVGQGRDWYIGAARESIHRKKTVFLSPSEGFWVIGLCNGDTYKAQASPPVTLELKQKPWRITVELDCDKGKVVFVNADDSTAIYTFKDKFTEKVFPYFSPGLYDDERKSSPLKICPQTVCVEVE